MRPIPQVAINFVKQHEACVLRVYDDAQSGYVLQLNDKPIGTLTAGYGHTGGLFVLQNVTQDIADGWLSDDLKEASARLASVVDRPVIDALTDNQYSALLSFVFNVGADPKWTIWKVLNAKQFDQVPLELAKFVNAGGKKLQGLVNRRNFEITLWSLNEPGSEDINPPSSMTRDAITPPTVSDPVPPSKSKTIISAVAGVATAVPAAATQMIGTISPYAEHSDIVGKMVAGLAVIAAIAAGLVLIFVWVHKHNARN